jgi:hypothetical protein
MVIYDLDDEGESLPSMHHHLEEQAVAVINLCSVDAILGE